MKSISLSIITLFISTYASAGNYNYNDYYLVGGSFGFYCDLLLHLSIYWKVFK